MIKLLNRWSLWKKVSFVVGVRYFELSVIIKEISTLTRYIGDGGWSGWAMYYNSDRQGFRYLCAFVIVINSKSLHYLAEMDSSSQLVGI